MGSFAITLRVLSASLLGISLLHLFLGLNADALLGVDLSTQVIVNSGLSSQNRFFGVAYAIYAVILWLAASELPRYKPVLQAALIVTMIAGASRFIPWVDFGAPPVPVIFLLATELLIPPVMLLWLSKLALDR